MRVRNKIFPRSVPEAAITTFLFLIIPYVYYFELFAVLPKFYEEWSPCYILHFVLGTFIMWNICTNLVATILCDTSIKGKILPSTLEPKWRFCSSCECIAPPRSWHCKICNVCILKRDHHCLFTGCCIGYENQRYFIMFVFYMFIATIYASYYNFYYINTIIKFSSFMDYLEIVFPLAAIFVRFTWQKLHLFVSIIVFIGACFTGVLLYYHLKLVSKGSVMYELKEDRHLYDLGLKKNIVDVFGHKWFLVWLSPLMESKLPHDGIHWSYCNTGKGK